MPLVKLVLILAVVMIHSNVGVPATARDTFGGAVVEFVFSQACGAAVPLFFVISGYLFFLGVERFDLKVYCRKLRSRVHTLLIPYLLWNVVCAALFCVKVKYMGFDGLGLFAQGHILWPQFLYGFITIDRVNMPFAMAFWFVRNLMVFVVLSPVFWFIARRTWLLLLFLVLNCFSTINIYYSELFLLGAALGVRNIKLDFAKGRMALAVAAVLFVAATLAMKPLFHSQVNKPVFLVMVFSGLVLVVGFAVKIESYFSKGVGRQLCEATFFIYSVHQCFCTMVKRMWLCVTGDATLLGAVAAMVLTFASLVAVSFALYLAMKRCAPGLLAILTGGRGAGRLRAPG